MFNRLMQINVYSVYSDAKHETYFVNMAVTAKWKTFHSFELNCFRNFLHFTYKTHIWK